MSDEKNTEAQVVEMPKKEEPIKLSQKSFNEFNTMRETIDSGYRNMGQMFTNLLRMAADVERGNRNVEKLFVDSLKDAGIPEENFEEYQIELQTGTIVKRQKQ